MSKKNPFTELSTLIYIWIGGAAAPSLVAYRKTQLWPGLTTGLAITGWIIRMMANYAPTNTWFNFVRELHRRRAHEDLVREEGAFAEAVYSALRNGQLGAWIECIPNNTHGPRWKFIEDQLGIKGFIIPGMEEFLQNFPSLLIGDAADRVYDQIHDQSIGFFTFLGKRFLVTEPLSSAGAHYKRAWAKILCYSGENVEYLKGEYQKKLQQASEERDAALQDNRSDR